MDGKELLLRITETEFAALDLQLFLDTHPCDAEAIKRYNTLVIEAEKLRGEYETKYGPLFSYITSSDPGFFSWIDGFDELFLGENI